MSILVSPLIDKGYFNLCFRGGCATMLISILCTAWCHEFWELLPVQGILTGFGMGVAFWQWNLSPSVILQFSFEHYGWSEEITLDVSSDPFCVWWKIYTDHSKPTRMHHCCHIHVA